MLNHTGFYLASLLFQLIICTWDQAGPSEMLLDSVTLEVHFQGHKDTHHLESHYKCKLSGPSPDLLTQKLEQTEFSNLSFNKLPSDPDT